MKYKLLFFVVCFFAAVPGWGQIISTVAGGGTNGYVNDTPALDVGIGLPYGITLDNLGNIYFANSVSVYKINNAGIITIVAGNYMGFGGDGGPATAAGVYWPAFVVIDASGNIFFTDVGNNRIRKVNDSGIISTIAGTGDTGYTGDNGAATLAEIGNPTGITIDGSGNIYVCDGLNNCIRKINTSGIITTIAGTGAQGYTGNGGPAIDAELDSPYGIALDGAGNIYFTEFLSSTVRKINTSGIISLVAGIGISGYNGDGIVATNAKLNQPTGVTVGSNGNIYIGDGYNERVRIINNLGIINTIAGDGSSTFGGDGGLATLAGVDAVDVAVNTRGDLYISDFGNNRIRFVQNTVMVNSVTSDVGKLVVYPNPNNGTFTIKIVTDMDEQCHIMIKDVEGDLIKEFESVTNQPVAIELDVPPGLYILNAVTGNASINEQLILMK